MSRGIEACCVYLRFSTAQNWQLAGGIHYIRVICSLCRYLALRRSGFGVLNSNRTSQSYSPCGGRPRRCHSCTLACTYGRCLFIATAASCRWASQILAARQGRCTQPMATSSVERETEPAVLLFTEPIVCTSSCELISQGAEAVSCSTVSLFKDNSTLASSSTSGFLQRVWSGEFLGRPVILKQRFNKQYRHPKLDSKLNTNRLKQVGQQFILSGCSTHL